MAPISNAPRQRLHPLVPAPSGPPELAQLKSRLHLQQQELNATHRDYAQATDMLSEFDARYREDSAEFKAQSQVVAALGNRLNRLGVDVVKLQLRVRDLEEVYRTKRSPQVSLTRVDRDGFDRSA
jgi:hypothetical protein